MIDIHFSEEYDFQDITQTEQIIQIVDVQTNICYEIVKYNGNVAVHYNDARNQYIVKQFIDKEVRLEQAIQWLGLRVDDFTIDPRYEEESVERLLQMKVAELPLLQGTIECPRCIH
jgi:hypothetical protein